MFLSILIFSFISGSGTISRNQQGSREDLHSAESRDSRISTNANSQSSSVYDNVKVWHIMFDVWYLSSCSLSPWGVRPVCISYYISFQESQRRHEFGSVRERRNVRSSGRDGRDGREGREGGEGGRQYARPRHSNQTGSLKLKKDLGSKSVDYSDMDTVREGEKGVTRKQRSKSIDQLNHQAQVRRVLLSRTSFMWRKSFDGSVQHFEPFVWLELDRQRQTSSAPTKNKI